MGKKKQRVVKFIPPFKVGELVFAKMTGHPEWPGYVSTVIHFF